MEKRFNKINNEGAKKNYSNFSKPKFKPEYNIVFGTRPVLEAIEAGKEIEKILLQTGSSGPQHKEIAQQAKALEIPLQTVPIEKLDTITKANHQGIIAFISPIVYSRLDFVLEKCYEKGKTPLFLITDHITDVRNFGAIARTAECAGVDAIIIPSKGNAQINADAVKTSAGALNYIPICREDSLIKTVKYLIECGISIAACTEKATKLIYEADFNRPLAIVMGAEDTGISHDILKIADEMVKIPMHGKIGSLNVSVSAGLIIYEALRQRAGDK